MPAKPSHHDTNLLSWLLDRGEETLSQTVQDLVHGHGLPDGLGKLFDEAGKTKGRLDKNVEMLLHFLNLPSRADYNKLAGKLEHLQGSLVNLNMKLDRLLAAQTQPHKRPRRKAKVGAPDRR
ncbi:MAG: hypothetical protein U0587_10720 [Candidatus Binatia bacterium]